MNNETCNDKMADLRSAQNKKFREQKAMIRALEKRVTEIENGTPSPPTPQGKWKGILGSSAPFGNTWYGLEDLINSVADGGGNMVRISAHGYAWDTGLGHPYVEVDGCMNLMRLHPDFIERLCYCLDLARRRGVTVVLDLGMDTVSASHPQNWERCGLNGENNTLGHVRSGVDYKTRADYPGQKTDPVNAIEGVFKAQPPDGCGGSNQQGIPWERLREARRYYENAVHDWLYEFAVSIDSGVLVLCTGNELTSRTMEFKIADWFGSGSEHQIMLNGFYWYTESWEQLRDDPQKIAFLDYYRHNNIEVILRLHHWGPAGTAWDGMKIYNRLAGLLAAYPNVKLLPSSDGVKDGSEPTFTRNGNRPTYVQERATMNAALALPEVIGWEGKTLSGIGPDNNPENDTDRYIEEVF